MPLAGDASRPSNKSTKDVALNRVLPSVRPSRSKSTSSGTPSEVKVWTINSGGVTHDPAVAVRLRREVRLRDGLVEPTARLVGGESAP